MLPAPAPGPWRDLAVLPPAHCQHDILVAEKRSWVFCSAQVVGSLRCSVPAVVVFARMLAVGRRLFSERTSRAFRAVRACDRARSGVPCRGHQIVRTLDCQRLFPSMSSLQKIRTESELKHLQVDCVLLMVSATIRWYSHDSCQSTTMRANAISLCAGQRNCWTTAVCMLSAGLWYP